jgi:hypothetical protein
LFDGLDGGKKLFVITCNDTHKLNDCLKNRPGRFHYHFKLNTLAYEEIKEYLMDKLYPEYTKNIDEIVRPLAFMDVTYDYLRAICFELNQGYGLRETLKDLNISQKDKLCISVTVKLSNGRTYYSSDSHFTLSEDACFSLRMRDKTNEDSSFMLQFNFDNLIFNFGEIKIKNIDKVTIDWDEDWMEEDDNLVEEHKKLKIEELKIRESAPKEFFLV